MPRRLAPIGGGMAPLGPSAGADLPGDQDRNGAGVVGHGVQVIPHRSGRPGGGRAAGRDGVRRQGDEPGDSEQRRHDLAELDESREHGWLPLMLGV